MQIQCDVLWIFTQLTVNKLQTFISSISSMADIPVLLWDSSLTKLFELSSIGCLKELRVCPKISPTTLTRHTIIHYLMHCHRLFTIIEQSFKTPHAQIDKGKMWSLTLTYSMVGSIPAPSLQEKERTLFNEHINSLAQLRVCITASVCVCELVLLCAGCTLDCSKVSVQPHSPEVFTPQYGPH